MPVPTILVLMLALASVCGCAAASTPTPAPTPVPSPIANPESPAGPLPAPVANRNAPTEVPGCKGAQPLDEPVPFTWAGIDEIVANTPATNWTYYRCGQSRAALAAFYKQWMPQQPYGWIEYRWMERDEATMAVYFYTTLTAGLPNRWLYLWFLPGDSADTSSYLVAAWWGVLKSC